MLNENVVEQICCQSNPVLVLENNKPVVCEDCGPCDVYFEAGFDDADIVWRKCATCQAEADAFTKEFWNEKLAWRLAGDVTESNQKTARINGIHYVLGNGDGTSPFSGCGGRKNVIEFTDGPHAGQTIVCRDLWYQGEIDAAFVEHLPDNAKFVPSK